MLTGLACWIVILLVRQLLKVLGSSKKKETKQS